MESESKAASHRPVVAGGRGTFLSPLLSSTAGWRTFSLVGLFVVGLLGAIYVAKTVLLPVVLALFLHLLLRPIHRFLVGLRLGSVPAALLILFGLLAVLVTAGLSLHQPLVNWVNTMPRDLRQAEYKLAELLSSFEPFREFAKQVEEIAEGDDAPQTVSVEIGGRFSEQLFSRLQQGVTMAVVTLLLMFFFLGYGQVLNRKLVAEFGPVDLPDQVGPEVSRYLLTIATINVCLGAVLSGAMYLLGVPNPLLWGAMATLLNFVPYLGAVVGTAVMLLVAMLNLDDSTRILLVPLVYLLITSIEGSLITPMILGRRFTLNPIVIFLWLMLWGWLWGIPGAVVAVPLLMAFRIFCEHVPPLAPLVRILGR